MKTRFYKIIYFCFAFCLMLSAASILSGFIQVVTPSESWAASAVAPTRTLSRKDQDDGVTRTYTLIESEGNLAWLMAQTSSSYISKDYLLTRSLDMGGATWTAIGAKSTSIVTYSKTFNGDGNVIRGLSCSVTSNYAGLFAKVSGTIKNLHIEDSTFKSTQYAGSIAAYLAGGTIKNSGTHNCSVTADYSSNSSIYAGGIVGYVSSGTIQRVDSTGSGTIKGNQPSDKKTSTGYVYAGGVVGRLAGGTIKSCLNTVYVNAYTYPTYGYAGGIAGYSSGTVTECINKGEVKVGDNSCCSESYAGGIVGYSTTNISNCSNFGAVYSYAKNIISNQDSASVSWSRWGICGSFDVYRYCSESQSVNENKAYAGGIVGFLSANKSVSYCYTTTGTVYGGGKYFTYSGSFGNYAYNDRIWPWSDQETNTVYLSASKTYLIHQYRDAICGNSRVSNSSGGRTVTISSCYSVNDFDNFYNSSNSLISASSSSGSRVYAKYDGSTKSSLYWSTGTMQSYGWGYGRCYLSINASGTNATEPIGGYELCYIDGGYSNRSAFEKVLTKVYTTKSSGIKSISLGSAWTTDSSINDGYPFPKSMYWKHS